MAVAIIIIIIITMYASGELAGGEAEPEAPRVVQRHDAAGVVAGAVATAVVVHRQHQVERVAHVRPDGVADEQRCSGHQREVGAVARHHVEQDQRQQPQRQRRPSGNDTTR